MIPKILHQLRKMRCRFNQPVFSMIKSCSTTATNELTIKKCPGVMGLKSLGESDRQEIGWKFKPVSTCNIIVLNYLYVKDAFSLTCRKWCLTAFMADTQMPPKWGDRGGMKRQVICSFVKKYENRFQLSICWNSRLALTNWVPLKE